MGEYFVDLYFCICAFLRIKHDAAAAAASIPMDVSLKYFFVIEIGKIQLDYTPFRVISFLNCNLVGFKPLDQIQLCLSYLGNSLDKLTSKGIRNCKISFKLIPHHISEK